MFLVIFEIFGFLGGLGGFVKEVNLWEIYVFLNFVVNVYILVFLYVLRIKFVYYFDRFGLYRFFFVILVYSWDSEDVFIFLDKFGCYMFVRLNIFSNDCL